MQAGGVEGWRGSRKDGKAKASHVACAEVIYKAEEAKQWVGRVYVARGEVRKEGQTGVTAVWSWEGRLRRRQSENRRVPSKG